MNTSQPDLSIGEYEELILANPHELSNYWHLGLLLLLQEREEEAQLTWMNAILEVPSDQLEARTQELLNILYQEAKHQEDLKSTPNLQSAYLIRQHIQEIDPSNLDNLFQTLHLCIELDNYDSSSLIDIIELLKSLQYLEETNEYSELNENLVFSVWQKILDYEIPDKLTLEFISSCIGCIKNKELAIKLLIGFANKFNLGFRRSDIAIEITKICLDLDSSRLDISALLSLFYQELGDFSKGIEIAKNVVSQSLLSNSILDRITPTYTLLRGLTISGSNWQQAFELLLSYESLLAEISEAKDNLIDRGEILDLLSSVFYFPYFRDDGRKNRQFVNLCASLCQSTVKQYASDLANYCQSKLKVRSSIIPQKILKKPSRKIKVGYLCSSFCQHSVGWLARSLLQYQDRNIFEVFLYFAIYKQTPDPLQDWYEKQADHVYKSEGYGPDYSFLIAKKICDDEIDILIELDSISSALNCELLSIKPAPIQITWLGWDASGIPAIDYFIADPYVLPNEAEEYYSEKIWRLPHTFIAVDGFEVGTPTLRREDLQIPEEAITYFTGQGGQKRHPDTIRMQMQIIKNVPNSYLLIKGSSDQNSLKDVFCQIAYEEDVRQDRLRFLLSDPSEAKHRANLSIADVVLDTYPYNGATTTLETLWMGIPLVTRLGDQFSARNSYTMMMNVGVTEGIAWTDEEYVVWGIRFGKEQSLRQQVTWKLRQSRQTSPLWNGEQFTREMESAYQQMWMNYVQSLSDSR